MGLAQVRRDTLALYSSALGARRWTKPVEASAPRAPLRALRSALARLGCGGKRPQTVDRCRGRMPSLFACRKQT
jgi:hypothetical protein